MNRHHLFFDRAALTLTALILAGSPGWAQLTVSPRAASAAAVGGSPISPFLFGEPAYPFRATAPSSYRGATLPDQGSVGIFRGPSLDVASTRSVSAPSLSVRSQPAIGAFIGFATPSSLLGVDSTSSLPGSGYRPASDNRAHIWLRVPADAQVWFDGRATKQTGLLRLYDSPPLAPGKKFVYEVRVRWMKDGKPIEQNRRITVEAKDWLRFDLTQPPAP